MNIRRTFIGALSFLFLFALLAPDIAEAAGRSVRTPVRSGSSAVRSLPRSSPGRTLSMPSRTGSSPGSRASLNIPSRTGSSPGSRSISRSAASRSLPGQLPRTGRSGSSLDRGNLPNWNTSPFGGSNRGLSPLADLLHSQYGRGYNDRYYDPNREMAKAYRDVGIANAVVGLVGVLATVAAQENRAVAATPVYGAAPAVAPSGRIERQQVLVREGRIEEYTVWVPEHTIPGTGEKVLGHHQTRQRSIAPIYETREVWVP